MYSIPDEILIFFSPLFMQICCVSPTLTSSFPVRYAFQKERQNENESETKKESMNLSQWIKSEYVISCVTTYPVVAGRAFGS